MKLKKKTSMMLVAASAVAVAGIAAISFAAWAGDNNQVTANAATGEAYLVGFENTNPIELGTLVPYDQSTSSIKEGTTYVSAALPTVTAEADYTITVEATTELSFYVLVSESEVTAAPTSLDGWTEVTAAGATFTFAKETTNTYISLILVSDDTTEMNSDTVEFTVTLNK